MRTPISSTLTAIVFALNVICAPRLFSSGPPIAVGPYHPSLSFDFYSGFGDYYTLSSTRDATGRYYALSSAKFATHDSINGRGLAFLYRDVGVGPESLQQIAVLIGEDEAFPMFGNSTAITLDGDMAAIGAPFADDSGIEPGAIYLYRNLNSIAPGHPHTILTPTHKLLPSEILAVGGPEGHGFQLGHTVAAHGDTVLAGAPFATAEYLFGPSGKGTGDHGAVYVYRRLDSLLSTRRVEDLKLMASDNYHPSQFGIQVSYRSGTAVVGAAVADHTLVDPSLPPAPGGAAYLYLNVEDFTGTIKYEDAKLLFPYVDTEGFYHGFGTTTALDERGQIAAVSAPFYDLGSINSGAVFVYNDLRASGTVNPVTGVREILPSAVLGASDGANEDLMGIGLSVSENTLIAGAPGKSGNQGAIYFYTDISSLNSKISRADVSLNDQGAEAMLEQAKAWISQSSSPVPLFGSSVSVSGTRFMAGAKYDFPTFLGGSVDKIYGGAYHNDTRVFLGLEGGDPGYVYRTGGLSFWSRQDWIMGGYTSDNTLLVHDEMNVNRVIGTQLIVGDNGNNNTFRVEGPGVVNSYDINVGINGDGNVFRIFRGRVNVAGTPSEDGVLPGPRDFTMGVNAGADNNQLLIEGFTSVLNVDGTTTIGRSGSNNYAEVTGVINTGTLVVGENPGANSNLLWIRYIGGPFFGMVNVDGTTTIGADGNLNNEMRVDHIFTGQGTTTINPTGVLSGYGLVQGDGLKEVYGKHTPGHDGEVAVQTIAGGNLTMHAGSLLYWDLTANTTAGRGTVFDGINVQGSTNVTVVPGASIQLAFDAPGSTVNWANSFWDVDYLGTDGWLMYQLADGSFFGMDNFSLLTSLDSLGQSLSALRPGASFFLFQDGNDVYLNFSTAPIPEPSAFAVIALIGIGIVLALRKTKKVS